MLAKDLLTICICVKNGDAYVDTCLESVTRETEEQGISIIVVNHNSQDKTAERLKRWKKTSQSRIEVYDFSGEGIAAVRDYAWRLAQTPWIGFLDIDCKMQKGWMQSALLGIQTHQSDSNANPKVAAFGGSNLVPNCNSVLYRSYKIMLATYIGGHNSILNREIETRKQVDHCPTLNVIYRKATLEKTGGFNLEFTRVAEDLEMSYSLKQLGYELWVEPGMKVEHALRPTFSGWLKNMYLYGRGRWFFIQKHFDSFEVKFLAPALISFLYLASSGLWWVSPLFLLGLMAAHWLIVGAIVVLEVIRKKSSILIWLTTTTLIFLTHIVYGFGFLRQMLKLGSKFD
jgi:GT2 family glycosyltransferase